MGVGNSMCFVHDKYQLYGVRVKKLDMMSKQHWRSEAPQTLRIKNKLSSSAVLHSNTQKIQCHARLTLLMAFSVASLNPSTLANH